MEGGQESTLPHLHHAIHAPHTPSEAARQLNRFTNTFLSSATISMIRALLSPAPPPVSQETAASRLPEWFSKQYSSGWKMQSFFRQYSRDTLILTVAAYLMDAVDYSLLAMRQVDDAFNRMGGGIIAGSLVGAFWYPANPTGRAVLGAIGGLSGYGSWMMQQTTKVVLMDAQRKLEQELGVVPNERKATLDPWYVKELMRIKYLQEERKMKPTTPTAKNLNVGTDALLIEEEQDKR
jgi:hypothetical protein